MKARILWGAAPIVVVMVLFVSCAYKPYHATKTEREWTLDHEACERWAREGIRSDPDTYDAMDEMKMIRHCMKEKGWQWKRTGLFKPKTADAE